jgi:predicted ester cyclase
MKKLLLILPAALILCFMVGCQDKEAMAECEAMKAQAEVEEQNKALILRWFEEDEQGNDEIWNEVCSPDYVAYFPSNSEPMTQQEHFQAWQVMKKAFPDVKETIVDAIAKDDKVVLRVIIGGTHSGELMGIPPTGKKVEWSGQETFRISDGKVIECWMDVDMLGLMMQLGMELKPKEGK